MADILIKNIELPLEERIQLSIYPNGLVINHSTLKIEKNRTTAVALPEHHGRLGDLDALYDTLASEHLPNKVFETIVKAPTVVEATE